MRRKRNQMQTETWRGWRWHTSDWRLLL
uniref:Uncharacterized protein n=1 Tax=Arundo donax TaxID=35708 RepID=A0A0A8ZXY5_ARUDO